MVEPWDEGAYLDDDFGDRTRQPGKYRVLSGGCSVRNPEGSGLRLCTSWQR